MTGVGLLPLLQDLSFVKFHEGEEKTSLCLSIRMSDQVVSFPCVDREVFRIDGLCGQEQGNDFYLTEGTSLLHLQVLKGEGEATLLPPPSFSNHHSSNNDSGDLDCSNFCVRLDCMACMPPVW